MAEEQYPDCWVQPLATLYASLQLQASDIAAFHSTSAEQPNWLLVLVMGSYLSLV
jgi:hypothetical protein